MAHPLHHAESSARRWGGTPEDYQAIHDWFDASKAFTAARCHRALRHHAQGIFEAETRFGRAIRISSGRLIPVRWIGEQHVKEDCGGRVPSLEDWLERIEPRPWMLAGRIEDGDDDDGPVSVARWRAEIAGGRTLLGYADWILFRGGDHTIRPFLDLSTGHLTEATRAALEPDGALRACVSLLEGAFGWMIHVPTDEIDTLPGDLAAILLHARALGCEYVLLDADGPFTHALPWHGEEAP